MAVLPEIIFSSSDQSESKKISAWLSAGEIRKLIPRVYSSDLASDPAELIMKNWRRIVGQLFPSALLTHRSAIEFDLSPNKNLYLTYKSRRVIKWPGMTIRMIKGPGPLSDDRALYGSLHVSSLERACLENLVSSRAVNGELRIVEQAVLEERLIQVLDTRGENGLNDLRDRARDISEELSMEKSFEKLNKIISALLTTQSSKHLTSQAAAARAVGRPYDSARLDLFGTLLTYLQQCTFEQRFTDAYKPRAFSNMAFIEAYFSNYIEGTTFAVEEAEDIVFNGAHIENRTGDSHDVKGTYDVCVDYEALSQLPSDSNQFIDLLRRRHAIILAGRPEKNPGAFKTKANRAGSTYFVDPSKVLGTLEHGFELMSSLLDPMSRAIYMMFLVSEVHPFDDGNGRMARIMMNAELVAGQMTKIIIPTVYREDYLLNLKKFTKRREPSGFVKMMDKAHCFSHWLRPSDLNNLKDQLHLSNAFRESDEATLQFPTASKSSFPKS